MAASAAKRIRMDPAREDGGATGYHMRHDRSALPSRSARGEFHASSGPRATPPPSPIRKRPRPPLSSRRPRAGPGRSGAALSPTDCPARSSPALRGRETAWGAGGLVAGEFRRALRAQPAIRLLYAKYERARGQSRPPGGEICLTTRRRPFAPIGFVSNSPQLSWRNPKVPYRSVQELVAWAKRQPGQAQLRHRGVGTLPHLTYEAVQDGNRISALQRPLRGRSACRSPR